MENNQYFNRVKKMMMMIVMTPHKILVMPVAEVVVEGVEEVGEIGEVGGAAEEVGAREVKEVMEVKAMEMAGRGGAPNVCNKKMLMDRVDAEAGVEIDHNNNNMINVFLGIQI